MQTRSHASEIDAACEKDQRAKVPKGKENVTNRGKQPTGAHDILVQRVTSIGCRLKENIGGDGHCGIYSAIDQLQQQGFNTSLQSLRTDVAGFLIDKEYTWSQFPQCDASNWALFVEQVGYTGPGGFFVNHTVFAAIACMYDCDLTIIQSMHDDTHAFQLLSGQSLALQLIHHYYQEIVQCRKTKVGGVVEPLFLAQRGMEHIMGTELLSSPLSTHAPCPQIDSTVGSGPRTVTAAQPRTTQPSVAGAPSAGPLATQASTGQCAGLRQQAV